MLPAKTLQPSGLHVFITLVRLLQSLPEAPADADVDITVRGAVLVVALMDEDVDIAVRGAVVVVGPRDEDVDIAVRGAVLVPVFDEGARGRSQRS